MSDATDEKFGGRSGATDTATDASRLRVWRPPEPPSGAERLEQARREGEADGRRWAQRKAWRGSLYLNAYFTAYIEAFRHGARDVATAETLRLPPVEFDVLEHC